MSSEIQKERVKNLFIEYGVKTVRAEGVKSVTVRKIAKNANFSYATIYNYFKDLNHLLWHITMVFIREMVDFLSPYLKEKTLTLEGVKKIYHQYIKYFLENPHAFELIFFNQIGPPPEDLQLDENPSRLAELVLDKLAPNIGKKHMKPEEKRILADVLTTSIHGSLLLFFAGKAEGGQRSLFGKIDNILDFLLSKE